MTSPQHPKPAHCCWLSRQAEQEWERRQQSATPPAQCCDWSEQAELARQRRERKSARLDRPGVAAAIGSVAAAIVVNVALWGFSG